MNGEKIINVSGVGQVRFPDTMSSVDIERAIETEILPQAQRARATQIDMQRMADPRGGFLENVAAGAGKAVADVGRTVGSFTGMVSPQDIAESRQLDRPLMTTGGGIMGNILGNVAMAAVPGSALRGAGAGLTALNMPRIGAGVSIAGQALLAPRTYPQALAGGATIAAAQPTVEGGERLSNVLTSVPFSLGGQVIARGLQPTVRPEIELLRREGVTPTIGQTAGGLFKTAEEKAMSIPITGDVIASAQRKGVEQLNRAMYNRALSPIGEASTKPVGREAVAEVADKLSKAYDDALSGITVQGDQFFGNDLRNIYRAVQTLPDQQSGQFDRILKAKVFDKITPQGSMTGEQMKAIESELGRLAKNYMRSPDFDVRQLGEALENTQTALREMVGRSDPGLRKRISEINLGWAHFVRIRNAASRAGSAEGIASPEAIRAAVRASDPTRQKGGFAKGGAMMQDLAEAGVSVLGGRYPESGTAGRLLMGGGMLGAGFVNPAIPIAAGAASIPYLPGVRGLLSTAASARRPEALRRLQPYAQAMIPAGAGLLASY